MKQRKRLENVVKKKMTKNKKGAYPRLKPCEDERFKIMPEDYDLIREQHKELKSYRAVGRIWNVDRHTIKKIVCPEWYKDKQEKRYAKKPWLEQYQNNKGEKWRKALYKSRDKVKKLYPEEFKEWRKETR